MTIHRTLVSTSNKDQKYTESGTNEIALNFLTESSGHMLVDRLLTNGERIQYFIGFFSNSWETIRLNNTVFGTIFTAKSSTYNRLFQTVIFETFLLP